MEISISCETYVRLASLAAALDPADKRQHLKAVYVESRKGRVIALATDIKRMAVEFVAELPGVDDGNVSLIIDPILINQCNAEKAFDSRLHIVYNAILGFASVKTTFGFEFQGNACVPLPVETEFQNWRDWLPSKPVKATKGAMFSRMEGLAQLAAASPTGSIVWPEFIDNTQPVIVRDIHDQNWLGVFMPNRLDEHGITQYPEPATLPGWCK